MTFGNYISRSVAIAALSTFACAGASAATITFDQTSDTNSRSGELSYDGNGGSMRGTNISFSYINLQGDGNGPSELTCLGCRLNFFTGNNSSEPVAGANNGIYQFEGGGEFTLTGQAFDGDELIAENELVTGSFSGIQVVNKNSSSSLQFSGYGNDRKAPGILTYFGIDEGTEFNFSSTNIALNTAQFESNGAFSGGVTNADLDNSPVPNTDVPEPQELAIFGLGLVLLVGGIAARRRSTDGDLIG